MNIYQRLVLILGALALAAVFWTAPDGGSGGIKIDGLDIKIDVGEVLSINTDEGDKTITTKVAVIDLGQLILRSAGVLLVTLLLFFALKGVGGNRANHTAQGT